MANVSIRRLCKDKPSALGKGGPHRILHDISMEIADGEFLVLVGPSGCGKTTLLRCIAGLEEPSSGELAIGDHVVNDVPPQARDIAMVFQSYALYPHMTVAENLSFGLKMRRTAAPEIKKLVEEAAQMLEISHLLSRYPRELSGGQRQRVAMGRAVVRRPKAFLFDEPLSNLDAALRQQMRLELLRLHRRLKATMIYVTHDQVEAMTLADRIAVLRQGRIEQMGTPAQLYDNPANTFVARFFGTPEMNLIDGTIEAGWFSGDGIPFRVHVPGFADQPVTLGVRAEDLHLHKADGTELPRGRIDVVEHHGHEDLLHVRCGDKVLSVRSIAHKSPPPGTDVHLVVSPENCHLFQRRDDKGDGNRLSPYEKSEAAA
ncbi:MAG TPA: ABC transporter ATP-binding protein [Pseudomonadota bacterium]|jgi:multiple sugar transport system ATP-binding protein|nr:ABC transporter ATP-binding protein [Pseudomonadota bacterium]HND10702.1 ABC transporter ATP-binding protein [Pseudomonadota bacterium]HNF97302.1 ABC transporter ATP-binding protein [Pseudomonadota bacterium]HNK44384.1 ABC transporter ATP-binding protein [Pseudomonadota bacterium]HNN52913.1 ABC transporter ATP-binding protein [Pseudomonadota bacterium]